MSPEWIDRGVVLALHDVQIRRFGGVPGVRDEALLASALDRPVNRLAYGTPTLSDLAAAYAFGLGRNHPFFDGNKRVSFVVAALFLELHGRVVVAATNEIVSFWRAIAAGERAEPAIAAWFERHARAVRR